MRKKGFTLAEVLVTLGVIGIVAALTLPTLSTNYQTAACESTTAKFYVNMQEAAQRYMVRKNVESLADLNFDPEDFVNSSFKVVKTCYSSVINKCRPTSFKTNQGSSSLRPHYSHYKTYVLADGTAFSLDSSRQLLVDINGNKGPNRIGYDFWILSITDDGNLVDYGLPFSTYYKDIENNLDKCKSGGYTGCFNSFVANGFKFSY